jgi:hypothetical protein
MDFLPGTMSAYQAHSGGEWSEQNESTKRKRLFATLEALVYQVAAQHGKAVAAKIAHLAQIELGIG